MAMEKSADDAGIRERYILNSSSQSRAECSAGKWRLYAGEWMESLNSKGIQRDSKAIAGIVKARGKAVRAISSAVHLKRTAIEKVIAVEPHCGIRDGGGPIARKNSSGYIPIQGRQRRQSAHTGGRHREIPDLGDLVGAEAYQRFR